MLFLSLPNIFMVAYAQQADSGSSINLFGSTRPDKEKLVPNCSYRNEYNPYTKQTTKNEVCYPHLVPVTNGKQSQQNQKPPKLNNTDNNMMIYYYTSPKPQPQQESTYMPMTTYLESFESYFDEMIQNFSGEEGSKQEVSTPEQEQSSEPQEQNIIDEYYYIDESQSQNEEYKNEDISLKSWDNEQGYSNEDLSNINEQIDLGYQNEDISSGGESGDNYDDLIYSSTESGYENEDINY